MPFQVALLLPQPGGELAVSISGIASSVRSPKGFGALLIRAYLFPNRLIKLLFGHEQYPVIGPPFVNFEPHLSILSWSGDQTIELKTIAGIPDL